MCIRLQMRLSVVDTHVLAHSDVPLAGKKPLSQTRVTFCDARTCVRSISPARVIGACVRQISLSGISYLCIIGNYCTERSLYGHPSFVYKDSYDCKRKEEYAHGADVGSFQASEQLFDSPEMNLAGNDNQTCKN